MRGNHDYITIMILKSSAKPTATVRGTIHSYFGCSIIVLKCDAVLGLERLFCFYSSDYNTTNIIHLLNNNILSAVLCYFLTSTMAGYELTSRNNLFK